MDNTLFSGLSTRGLFHQHPSHENVELRMVDVDAKSGRTRRNRSFPPQKKTQSSVQVARLPPHFHVFAGVVRGQIRRRCNSGRQKALHVLFWFVSGGMATFPIIINSFVHVLMYVYYLLALFGPEMQKKLGKWKPRLTILQMVRPNTVRPTFFNCI